MADTTERAGRVRAAELRDRSEGGDGRDRRRGGCLCPVVACGRACDRSWDAAGRLRARFRVQSICGRGTGPRMKGDGKTDRRLDGSLPSKRLLGPKSWASLIPFGLGSTKPRHFLEMAEV